jgi:hypothetical protein
MYALNDRIYASSTVDKVEEVVDPEVRNRFDTLCRALVGNHFT